jgi:hypothetical protein
MQNQSTPVLGQTRITLIEAIARKQAVIARYNGAALKLAPHLIFERHGDLHVSALNLSKAMRSPDERQLGQFKLAGLSDAELLDETFDLLPAFDGVPPRTDDVAIFAIRKADA